MNLWTPGSLVSTNCPVSNCKHHPAASVYQQLGLSTPAKVARVFLTHPSCKFHPTGRIGQVPTISPNPFFLTL
jgi:hypothetical protein